MIRLLMLFLCLYFPLSARLSLFKWELSIGAIFQNDARFLKEWIEFHRLVGVEHFWLYNNNSSDNYKEILEPYIKSGIVELIEWPDTSTELVHWNAIQCAAYKDAVKRAQGKSFWLALLDTDEFLFSPENPSVSALLQNFKAYGGVGVNWAMFGTSSIDFIPENKLLIELLIKRAPLNHPINSHIKSIINPLLVKEVMNPHFFYYKSTYSQVTSSKIPFEGAFSPTIEHNLLRINHYWSRDEAFLHESKVPRGVNWGNTEENILNAAASYNQEDDFTIHSFIPALKATMFPTSLDIGE